MVNNFLTVPLHPKGASRLLCVRHCVMWICVLLGTLMPKQVLLAQLPSAATRSQGLPYRSDRFLIKPRGTVELRNLHQFHSSHSCTILQTFPAIGNLQVVSVPPGKRVEELIAAYQASDFVEFAEPDYARHLDSTLPNDPKFVDGTLWGLYNYGQNGGTAHADIDAPEAWDVLSSASNIVVAILDTGIRYTHEDLAANMWINPGDGSHGFNALNVTNSPADDEGHGTLMAGVLGGVGNNGKGVVGVAWQVQLMACKCFNSSRQGSDSDIITCIDYARTNGARIINASFSGPGNSLSMSNAISAAAASGIILVAASGDSAADLDVVPYYPACFAIDNIVSVAYTTRNDALGQYSGYGATNVDLAAPGAGIYSTFFLADNSYLGSASLQGTSYAAAYVSGALALMAAKYPAETHQQIISRLLNAVDPVPALQGKCLTGGRLNLRKALSPPIHLTPRGFAPNGSFQFRIECDPNRFFVVQGGASLVSMLPIYTNTTTANGTFDFTDSLATNYARRFYRVIALQ